MERIIILGTASAVPAVNNENTHILLESSKEKILVDCPGNPVVRLNLAGFEINQLTGIILTHFHPDHVSGFAPLLMSMWLVGRKQPITVYGLAPTIDRAEKMMDLYDWKQWPGFFPVNFVRVAEHERSLVIDSPDLRVYASPVEHLVPTIGLRFEFPRSGKTVSYSCDTEPSQVVRRLAQGADVLIHESTGSSKGHTSPEQAGEIAGQANAAALYLIHYPPQLVDAESLLARAKQTFSGPVFVARDLQVIDIAP
ncbi:MAG: MBL fold metallo-hydrolase [Anaerolineaceae bacterium]|nr:MBL fold metallo-hydrolase [Anaerolineaceae bacterium]